MIYLVLDTNIWIYMANGFDSIIGGIKVDTDHHFKFLEKIKTKVEAGDFKILVNEVIEKEWTRNQVNANYHIKALENERKRQINTIVKKKQELKEEEFKKKCKEINDYYKQRINANKKHINDVKELITSAIKYPIPPEIKLELAELAINRGKAPFRNNKNNMADAAILFGAIDFLHENMSKNFDGAIFVSNNYREFGKSKDSNAFHPDIEERVGPIFLEYHRHLGNLLDISEDMQYEIELFHENNRDSSDYFNCQVPYCYTDDYLGPFGIFDKKILVINSQDEYDSNQLNLFDVDTTKSLYRKFVLSGYCETCKTVHVNCPNCESLLVDVNRDSQFYCNNCEKCYEMRKSSRFGDYSIYQVEDERLHL